MPATKRPTSLDARGFEQLVFDTFEREKELYAPLEIRNIKRSAPSSKGKFDGLVQLAWQKREVEFQIEIKSRTAPKIIQETLWRLREQAPAVRKKFILVVPYITPRIREMIETEGVNCLDINGNYLIQHPELLAIRLDRKNQFPESTPIKKIFSGNSSLVGRLLLSKKRVYTSVSEIFESINQLGGELSLSAVSKVLSGLSDELIIEKSPNRIALLQPDKLLDRIQEGYAPPKSLATLKLKIPGSWDEILKTLSAELSKKDNVWMLSGETSVNRYAATTPPTLLRVYSARWNSLTRYEDTRFFNVVLNGGTEPYVLFDRQSSPKENICWASQLQTYLELSRMDKREREIAEPIRDAILKGLK